jgi:exodeoxyribonuclease VII small subunit
VAPKQTSIDLEKALQELEALVERLERGDLSLEESLKQFERGMELTRACQAALRDAEQRVEILTTRGGAAVIEPFDANVKSDDGD